MARRIGRMEVAKELLESTPDLFDKYLPDVQVLNVEESFVREGTMIYTGICDEFDEVREGELIPLYRWTFHRHENGSVTRERAEKVS